MNSRQKNLLTAKLSAALALVAVIAVGYYLFVKSENGTTTQKSTATSTATSSSTIATSSSAVAVDTSGWQTFTSYELGFSIQYPPDLTIDSSDPSAFKSAFPRTTYFSTVYADDVSVDVNVNATCTPIIAGSTVMPSENVSIGGVNFTKDETGDVGAGNIYDTTLYDALNNNVCYQITVTDHHANGAGLYESDPTKIAVLTATRAAEFAHVSALVTAMISSFSFISTPAGENEADYSAPTASGSSASGASSATSSATSTPTSTIFISTVSPTTISSGGTLTVIGQGFSGQDTLVQISNGSVQGILWGGMPTSDTAISTIVPDKVCTVYTGTSGAVCPSYLVLSPGTYTVDVSNQNGTTDTVYLKIK